MNDWLIVLGWLATGAALLFLGVLVLLPGVLGWVSGSSFDGVAVVGVSVPAAPWRSFLSP
jgi:hypothetical protein